jgi:light-harvesting complex II chlorophyll a/b binding protein 6
MALASTSATAVLKNPFLGARRALANAASLGAAAKPATRRVVVVAAAVGKKSWIPAFKSDAEFIDPSWLDGS